MSDQTTAARAPSPHQPGQEIVISLSSVNKWYGQFRIT